MIDYLAIPIVSIVALSFAYFGGQDTLQFHSYPSFTIFVIYAHIIQVLAFIPAYIYNTQKFYDLTGSITYISITAFSLIFQDNKISFKQYIAAAMILIWASRLGAFLFNRVLQSGEDSRFRKIKKSPLTFFNAWFIQGFWVTLTSGSLICVLLTDQKKAVSGNLGFLDVLGLCIWILGFLVEAIADQQKYNFKFYQNNKGKFIKTGLWKYSRHPNYVGQITLWFGAAIFAFSSLKGFQCITLISPVFIYLLLTKLSGVPLLERKAQKTWGQSMEYQEYKKSTPVLFPFVKNTEKDKSK